MDGVLELLSTTDAAVKALDKSFRSQSSGSSRASSGHHKHRDQTESHDSGIARTEQKSQRTDSVHPLEGRELWDRSSDESTTASDILIRSTVADPTDRSLLGDRSLQNDEVNNASSVSKYSKSSYGLDNFNSSGPQKIKISTKRLREIKSPYESPRDGIQITDGNGKTLNGAPRPSSAGSSKLSERGNSQPQSARSSKASEAEVNSRPQSSRSSKASENMEPSRMNSQPQSARSSKASEIVERHDSAGSSRHSSTGVNHQTGSRPQSGGSSRSEGVCSRPLSAGSSKHSGLEGSRPCSGGSTRSTSSKDPKFTASVSKHSAGQTPDSTHSQSAPITNNPKEIITLQSTPKSQKTRSRLATSPNDTKPISHPDQYNDDVNAIHIERHTPPKVKKDYKVDKMMDMYSDLQKKLDLSMESEKQVSQESSIHSTTSSRPEIITVPERIVTVSARNSVSTDNSVSDAGSAENIQTIREKVITISTQPPLSDDFSSNGDVSEQEEKIPPALLDRFLHGPKSQGPSLKQGSQTDGTSADQKHSSDVMVSQFQLSDKQRNIKQSFAKRYEQAGPKKRVIQPKIISHQRSEVSDGISRSGLNGQTSEAVTAAVAASAAIAVTQPFLKAQQDLETKMADILNKIAELKGGKMEQQEPVREQQKVLDLENKLADLTEQRIKHLESQVAMQAQLLSMRRNPDKDQVKTTSRSPSIRSLSRSPPRLQGSRSPSASPPMQRKFDAPKSAISKTKFSKPSNTNKRPEYSEWRNAQKTENATQSPLDTPNPRSKAPKPQAYQPPKDQKSRGILEEILASDGSPRRDVPTPVTKYGSQRDLQNQIGPLSPAVKKADDLVNELADIKNEMNSVLSDADDWKILQEKKFKDIEYEKAKMAELQGPSPLDPYLLPSSSELTSPYKSVPNLSPRRFNAPLLPGFTDAREVLQEVKQNKAFLEANMEAVLRSRKEAEVFSVMENMYQDSNPELVHIKKIVDKKVAMLRSQVEREVTDDVVRSEMKKNQPHIILNTTAVPPPPQRGLGQGRVGAKIDTGLSKLKGPSFGPPLVSKGTGKENSATYRAPVSRPPPAKPKVKSVFEDEEYMTRVYGKGSHQKGRTTVKDPYLHFQNVAKTKAERPPAAPDIKGGHIVKSAKTQTGPGVKQFYFSPTHGTYIPIASSTSAPIPGQLIPMAVPLGGPRMDGGLTEGVAVEPQVGPITSTPTVKGQVTAARNVTMVTFPAQDDLMDRPEPELSKQILPAIDIDTDISDVSPIPSKTSKLQSSKELSKASRTSSKESRLSQPPSRQSSKSPSRQGSKSPSSPSKGDKIESSQQSSKHSNVGDVYFQSPQQSPSKKKLEKSTVKEEEEEENSFTDVSQEDLSPENAPGIAIPGYQPPSPPPQPRPKEENLPPRLAQMLTETMDVLDDDIRRRELLENKAVQWIEQELMSRMIAEMPEIRHPCPTRPPELAHEALEESGDSMAEEKEESMFMMDCIGRQGLQIFVDAGQPVNSDLVNNLIKEVLEEKVISMLGQRPSEEGRPSDQRIQTKLSSAEDSDRIKDNQDLIREEELYMGHQLETPLPTPKHTPITSPERVISPPVTPPLSPVRSPRTPMKETVPLPEPSPVYIESEPESASIDISEEIRNLQAKLVQPSYSSPVQEVHDIATPVSTPIPEPEPEPEVQRPITPPIPTPRKEAPVKVVEQASPVVQPPPVVAPLPEVPVVEAKEEVTPPSSPEPKSLTKEPEQPQIIEVKQPVMVDRPVSPISPVKPESPVQRSSPTPSETESVSMSSFSDTVGQSVSEGQWLLNKSEGEVADFPIDEVEKMKLIRSAKQRAEISTASTMRGTDEIQDESTEFPISEGEFQYNPPIMPDKDPLLLLMSRFQHEPVQPGQFDMTSDQVVDFLDHTGKSAGNATNNQNGELSMGHLEKSMGEVRYVSPQKNRGRRSPDRYDDMRSPSPGRGRKSPDRRGRMSPERDEYGRMIPERDDYGRQSPSRGRRSPQRDQYGRQQPYEEEYYGGRKSPGQGRISPERDYGRKSPTRDRGSYDRDVNYGRRSPNKGRRSPSVSFEDEVNGRMSPQRTRGRESPDRGRQSPGRELHSPETSLTRNQSPSNRARPSMQGRRTPTRPTTPGGVSLGGGLSSGRTSPLKSSLRKPPMSQGVPEKSVTMSGTRTFNVRSSDEGGRYSQENAFSMSDRGTRTFTPDQMNMEELIQSGYLTQTFSEMSNSQGAYSVRSSRGSQGVSPDRPKRQGKSLGLTYSYESEIADSYSESELKRLAESGSLKMSVTLPSTGELDDSTSYRRGDL